MTKTNKYIVVPAGWIVYEVEGEVLEMAMAFNAAGGSPQALAVLESLVMSKKAKRLAQINTYNAFAQDEDESEGTLFGEGGEESD